MSLLEEKPQTKAERPAPEPPAGEALVREHRAPAPTSRARARPRQWRRQWLIALGALLVIGAAALGARWWLAARNWVSTDDAFIDVHVVQISPQVAGRVKAVLVGDNQEVRAGQPLVEIDPADFRARLDQALANEQSAQGQLAQAKAQMPVAAANLDAAKAQVAVAQAAATNAETNLKRDQALVQMGGLAVSRQQLDNDAATARSDAANLAAAQQRATAAQAQLALDRTQIATAEANQRAAAAASQQARLNLGYTEIRAAAAGHVANTSVAPGDYVQTGQALMALVPDAVWITANYKETEIGDMRVGDPVDIYVDAYPGHVFHGRVESFQAGSGTAFSLLPPENATGNYVKVVQRVPVKIVFNRDPGGRWLLGPGMSVEPYVKIH